MLNIIVELQYQPPPTCPANHILRVQLMKEISSAVLNSDITPTIGNTVTIRGIGGIGKSTIAKALCHDPLIKEHFVNGFLWISLTPPLPSPVTMLSEIYQRLTDRSATPTVSILISKIKSIISNQLLVILDDVWEVEDAMLFADVFSSCKIILSTRKMDINAKIPPKMCFDVKPMLLDEAVKLLTLNIFEVETLCATDVNRIEELVKDLHCWPLLLNLVHGQLYIQCAEWNQSPQDAIMKVQQKLFNNGLTAFDPENELNNSRENAVRASITASLEMLTKTEKIVLFYIASSVIGFGIYTIKDFLSFVLEMDIKQFDKCTRNLWCHGLISFQDVTFSNGVTKIPCIAIHEVIAHYINESMPDEFYLSIEKKIFKVLSDHDQLIDKYFNHNVTTGIGLFFLAKGDTVLIPFWIRYSIMVTKFLQTLFFKKMNELVGQNIQLLQNDVFVQNDQFPSVKHLHKIIERDCKSIHSLLVDCKYNDVITWTKEYFDSHPLKLTIEAILTHLNILLDSCKKSNSNYKVTLFIEDLLTHFSKFVDILNSFQRITTYNIIAYSHVLYLVNAVATDDDILCYLKSAEL